MSDLDRVASRPTPRCFVVGLGNIGGAIAGRLARRGVDVVGVDPSESARSAFEADTGCATADGWPGVEPSDGDRVVLLVRTVDQAHAVLRQLIAADVELAVFLMTTFDVSSATQLDALAPGCARIIEAPVSGGRSGAAEGSLTMMLAGPARDADRAFLLEHLAHHVVMFERYGQPTAAKLHNNALAAFTARAHAEILRIGRRNGLDVGRLHQVLTTSSGSSWMGLHLTNVVVDLLEKDVGLFEESFGRLEPIAIDSDSGLADALERAIAQLDDADGDG